LGDVFEAFFGGGTGSRGPVGRVRPGSDSLLRMRLDLGECATGVTKQVAVDTAVLCDLCQGKGTTVTPSRPPVTPAAAAANCRRCSARCSAR
jgi:DnaJ-class molecular chaperone